MLFGANIANISNSTIFLQKPTIYVIATSMWPNTPISKIGIVNNPINLPEIFSMKFCSIAPEVIEPKDLLLDGLCEQKSGDLTLGDEEEHLRLVPVPEAAAADPQDFIDDLHGQEKEVKRKFYGLSVINRTMLGH